MFGIGGLLRSGRRDNGAGAGTGGASTSTSRIVARELSGVAARSEFGVILRSWNLPGVLGRPFCPFQEREDMEFAVLSSALPKDS
jgi:hypothetical protein